MDCGLAITTWTSDAASTKNWYSKSVTVTVDGGANSKWLPYETFVKMVGPEYSLTPGLGHTRVVETQATTDVSQHHSPVVNLIFGACDFYTGGNELASANQPSAVGTTGLLRRLPLNNINAAANLRLKVSLTAGINVNTADTTTLVASWH